MLVITLIERAALPDIDSIYIVLIFLLYHSIIWLGLLEQTTIKLFVCTSNCLYQFQCKYFESIENCEITFIKKMVSLVIYYIAENNEKSIESKLSLFHDNLYIILT